jgi:hypothetical protein
MNTGHLTWVEVRRRLLGLAAAAAMVLPARVASSQDILPNLEPFPAGDIQLADGGNTLRFSTTSWNRGVVPMELVGGEIIQDGTEDNPGSRVVYQRVYSADGTSRLEYVGTFEYHGANHNHFHLEDYALYTLHPVNAPGATDRAGTKVSFCLLDNVKVNTRLPNAPKKPVYQTCNPLVQGISVGWGDTYASYLEGQSLDFTGNPSGDYLLTIEVNPLHHLFESNLSDNIACVLVRIDVTALSVQVLDTTCNPIYGTVTVNSITPNSIRAGSQTIVQISGSGFGNGVDVHFDNGSGKVPVVSNVTVVDASTIRATVNVPSGGSTGDPVWDLHVGAAVLPNAFTVVR